MTKKIRKEQVNVEKEVTEEIVCDFCGKSIEFEVIGCNAKLAGASLFVNFGYKSRHDGDVFVGDICDDCFDKVLASKLKKIGSR